ncbi:alcohol dehydrogenase catalytic domain-containing protein [Frigoribacterium sp. CFBP 8766]|uniref:zinc-dependent dehydrogenase n=1 Tax=Frigoribacterium sp. CFBP 8766 TaxID=2775273 RepID=UPI001781F05A|nr:alcohol dehydrogenase catalytic domain-containing protein [Frigoribacterium sp. CFBP 8766]
MRAAKWWAPGDVRLDDVATPGVSRGELLLRVDNCSACGTDLKILRSGHPHMTGPQVMGHEVAGTVVEAGDDVDGWAVGDRVQVIAAVPCGTCDVCRAGRPSVCPRQTSIGYQYAGGFAEFMVVPAAVLAVDGVNRVPDHVSSEEASLVEPLACVLNGQELARVGAGDSVLVIGSGPIGCMHVRLARARGARQVILVDANADRLARAAALVRPDLALAVEAGADGRQVVLDQVRAASGGLGVDVVITAAASRPAQEQALALLAPGGRLSLFGGLARDDSQISIDSNLVHYRELTIVGVNGSSPAHNREALRLIASGEVVVGDLITHRFPLDRLHDALEAIASGEAIKVTIEPHRDDRPTTHD